MPQITVTSLLGNSLLSRYQYRFAIDPHSKNLLHCRKTPIRASALSSYSLDQFIKDATERSAYQYMLQKHGLSLISATETIELTAARTADIDDILRVASAFKYMRFRYHAVCSMERNAERGFHNGGRPPFGYRTVSQGDKIVYALGPDEEVQAVQQIFMLAASGMGGKKIARLLNEQDIPKGHVWKPSSVLAILNNKTYLGHRIWNKKSGQSYQTTGAMNCHPAIIDQSLWESAQSCLQARKPL